MFTVMVIILSLYAFVAGVMLAHLHELQSENRSMQSRIMELASQREFFIATNSRLRQTLTGGGASSTIQTVSKGINGIQQMVPTPPSITAQPPISNHTHHNYHGSIDGESSSFPTRSPGNHHHVAMTTDSQQTGISNSSFSSSSGINPRPSELTNAISEPSATGHTHKSSFSPHGGGEGSPVPMSSYHYTPETTPTTNHEVTHVTNSVQGPIATFTGFPDNPAPYSSHQLFSQYSHRHST